MISTLGPWNSGKGVGADGAAAANADSPIRVNGILVGIYVKYNGDKPATMDTVIKTKGTAPAIPSRTLLTLTNKVTDGYFPVEEALYDNLGVANGSTTYPIIDDFINVAIAQANTDDSVDVWLLLVN